MATFTFKFSLLKLSLPGLLVFIFLFSGNTSYAQARNYSLLYSDNIKGSSTIFGNTLLHIVENGSVNTLKMNDNRITGNSIYGNDSLMQYVDIDGNTGNGSVTRNSSSSDLILPAGKNEIILARIYWGGMVLNSEFNLAKDANKKIKIRKGTENVYATVNAIGIDKIIISNNYTQYQAYADITAFVQSNGAGTYEAGNAPLSTGAATDGGYNGGWSILVVYENSNLNYNSIRVYDGFRKIYNGGNSLTTSVTLTGLNVPSGTLSSADAKMGALVWEGDAKLKEDFLKINGNLFSNATNPSDNPWNGTITDNGIHITTKNPDYTNQMGLDIDHFQVGTGYNIFPNDSSVTLQFGTKSDQYFPGLFTFSIRMKDPEIILEQIVTDEDNDNHFEKNEVLTYTLKGKNTGKGNANSIIITDTLPSAVTYLPNSLKVVSSPGVLAGIKTDIAGDDNAEYIVNGSVKMLTFRLGTGCTKDAGGTLGAGESYEVEFKVVVNDPGPNSFVAPIVNIARIKGLSDANVNFVDDGTAIINPGNLSLGGPLPATLVSFAGTGLQNNKVQLDWNTLMEVNCSQYKVERSVDGSFFYEVSAVSGNGTTTLKHFYSITDDVSSAAGSVVYYRLKQLDIDGKASLSKVIVVKLKGLNKQISISPNPFTSYLNINVDWNDSEIIIAKVIDVQGREIISRSIQMNKGLNYISIQELSKLSAGNYFIQLISPTERTTKKITRQ
ncbi:MAG: T9SS type A sorting domain-containing protein [Ginsengibacter sp.]